MTHTLRLSLALAALVLLSACNRPSKFPDTPVGTSNDNPLYLIPPGVDAVVMINPGAVMKSAWGADLMNSRAFTGGEQTKELEACLGNKLMSQTTPIAVGFWLPSRIGIGVMPQVVFVQATSYSAEQLAACNKKAEKIDLGGQTAWKLGLELAGPVPSPETGGPMATYFAQHGPFVIVSNDETRMTQTLAFAAKGGDGYFASPAARTALGYVDQQAALSAILTNPAPFGIEMFMAAGYVEITDAVSIQVVVELKTPAEASQKAAEINQGVNEMKKAYRAMMPPPIATLVDGISIASSGNLLTFKVKAERSTIDQIVGIATNQFQQAQQAALLQQAVGQRPRAIETPPGMAATPRAGETPVPAPQPFEADPPDDGSDGPD